MNICIINGSPKTGKSTSEQIIEYLTQNIKQHKISIYNIIKTALSEENYIEIRNCDVLIFVFPLYVDSIPAHLIKFLIELEKKQFINKNAVVYCAVNNGFFEGKQNHLAIEQIKFWCNSVKLKWGQGIGLGAGEMLPFLKDIPLGHGPNKNIGYAIKRLSLNIQSKKSEADILVSPNWPRILWKIQSSLLVWYPRAKSNGLKRRTLHTRLKDDV